LARVGTGGFCGRDADWELGGAGSGGAGLAASASSLRETLPSVTAFAMLIMCPHLRHFIRTDRPATFSSAIWYLALQLGQRNFIQAEIPIHFSTTAGQTRRWGRGR
jgi:hypothetical protein